jgi:hypothetical protein
VTPPNGKTVRLVPLDDLVALARIVGDMRKAQRRYFEARKKQPHVDHVGLLRESIDAERRCDAAVADAIGKGATLPGMDEAEQPKEVIKFRCTAKTPCCSRRGEYNGFASGPTLFTCPKSCPCHD